jgi:hypothetical protein
VSQEALEMAIRRGAARRRDDRHGLASLGDDELLACADTSEITAEMILELANADCRHAILM